MWDVAQTHEPIVRLSAFLGVFAVMALWEVIAPRRKQIFSRRLRWTNNLGLVMFNTAVVRLLFPAAAVGMAFEAEQAGWGLFNNLAVPGWLAIVLSVVVLDLAIYLQHVLVHAVPALWRLHRVHHADLDYDVTTGTRFHPIEIVISMALKLMVVGALGAPVLAVLTFEILLNATAMFNHGNIKIHRAIDRALRRIIVTPDMHRVHHSVLPEETNSNFGFSLAIWDRMFGTWRDQPRDGHQGMTIGINQFSSGRDLWFDRMLAQPFRGKAGDYSFDAEVNGSDEDRK